jgi:hypothetical protein
MDLREKIRSLRDGIEVLMGKIITLQQSMTAVADSAVLKDPVADPQELYQQQQQQQYEQQQQQLYHPQLPIWTPMPPGPPPG